MQDLRSIENQTVQPINPPEQKELQGYQALQGQQQIGDISSVPPWFIPFYGAISSQRSALSCVSPNELMSLCARYDMAGRMYALTHQASAELVGNASSIDRPDDAGSQRPGKRSAAEAINAVGIFDNPNRKRQCNRADVDATQEVPPVEVVPPAPPSPSGSS